MNNFNFCVPTDIRSGKGQIECLPEELAKYGKKILLVYGGGSIKRTGLYDTLMSLLKDFDIFELSGIKLYAYQKLFLRIMFRFEKLLSLRRKVVIHDGKNKTSIIRLKSA